MCFCRSSGEENDITKVIDIYRIPKKSLCIKVSGIIRILFPLMTSKLLIEVVYLLILIIISKRTHFKFTLVLRILLKNNDGGQESYCALK